MQSLVGRVGIVTGASSGIGAVTAKALSAAGMKVMLAARRGDALAGGEGYLHAVPIAWKGGATFPVRAYVMR